MYVYVLVGAYTYLGICTYVFTQVYMHTHTHSHIHVLTNKFVCAVLTYVATIHLEPFGDLPIFCPTKIYVDVTC